MVFVGMLLIDDLKSPNHPLMEGNIEPEKTLTFGCLAYATIKSYIGRRVEECHGILENPASSRRAFAVVVKGV